jgi:hypothetical protein
MEPFMHLAATTAAAVAAAAVIGTTGCLDPLVKDQPGASANLLPAGTVVPNAVDNLDLKVQLTLNDGLDDSAFTANKGVVRLGTGVSGGATNVGFWSFGPATQAPSPIYKFFQMTDAGLVPIAHPPLLDALPGDHGYGAIHEINQVVVTDAYNGELITTIDALADAIDLGLVNEPTPLILMPGMTMPGKYFVDCPVVLPNTTLDVGNMMTAAPETMYARGYTVTAFEFGGALGVQPIPAGGVLMPTSQVSYLREQFKNYDTTRPIFQATIPTVTPPPLMPNYTPLSVVVNVDLAPGVLASMITKDSDLFTRSSTGAITGTTNLVNTFQVTTSIQLLQLQFVDGMP